MRAWSRRARAPRLRSAPASESGLEDRIRGAFLGLAYGDAAGAASGDANHPEGSWTQHTALALCLAESLLATGGCDGRDQIERYLAWQPDGTLSADGQPGEATADVARALATYQWRRLPMAGSHDPRDRSTSRLPRVVSAAAFAVDDPPAVVRLAVVCSRTTLQSPTLLVACRCFAALLARPRGSNAGQVERLMPRSVRSARWFPLWRPGLSPAAGAALVESQSAALPWPLDLVVLGMGEDGHVARCSRATSRPSPPRVAASSPSKDRAASRG